MVRIHYIKQILFIEEIIFHLLIDNIIFLKASTSTNGKGPEKSIKTISEPVQKKLKKKSIFSPENSSESDSGIPTKANSVKSINSSTKYTKNQQSKPKPNDAKQKAVAPNRSSM